MSYTRTTSETLTIPVLVTDLSGQQSSNQSKSQVATQVRSGTSVPNYRELISQGLNAASAYSLDKVKLVLGPPLDDTMSCRTVGGPFTYGSQRVQGYLAAESFDITADHLEVATAKARSMALSKIYKKLEEDRSHVNAPAILAEIGDVLRQFGAPFSAIANALNKRMDTLYYERSRLQGSRKFKNLKMLQIIAETWLETSFGLLPLISDAEAVAEAFGRFEYEQAENPQLRTRIRSRAGVSSTSTRLWRSMGNGSTMWYNHTYNTETEARAQYTVGLKGDLRADFGSNRRLLELLGLEGRNIPLAIWEGIPNSWFLDYWTNVQQILEAGAAVTTRVNWIVLSETRITTQNVRSKPDVPPSPPPGWVRLGYERVIPSKQGESGSFKTIRTTFVRSIPASLGVPPLYFETPFGDLKKMANLAALVVTKSKSNTTPLWFP